jgi:UDP-N-acetylmuramate dehydrogenase
MKMMDMVSAHDVTSMRCGGTIMRVYEPENTRELIDLVRDLEGFHLLGGGTNTIFADETIARPVIRLGRAFAGMDPAPGALRAGAAVPMKRLVSFCVRNGLSGIEFMAGIPGHLGGAVFMNAGTPEKGILDAVSELEVVNASGARTLTPRDLPYGYRTGGIPERTVVTWATIALRSTSRDEAKKAVLPYVMKKRTQPRGFSCGSVFKNPPGAAAGMLIDRAGMKGYRVGGAKVSEAHANFIINDGTATCADVQELIRLIKEKVKARFGIALTEEVRIIGQ